LKSSAPAENRRVPEQQSLELLGFLSADAAFHFREGERRAAHFETGVLNCALRVQQHCVFEAKDAAKADSTTQPDLDLMADRETETSREGFALERLLPVPCVESAEAVFFEIEF
jgi:hypothetical protein